MAESTRLAFPSALAAVSCGHQCKKSTAPAKTAVATPFGS